MSWKFLLYRKSASEPDYQAVYTPGSSTGDRTVWIFSYTGVSNEPRVIRQAAAMLGAGWRVVVLGFDGHSPRPAEWHFVRLPRAGLYVFRSPYLLLLRAIRGVGIGLARFGVVPGIKRLGARLYHSALPGFMWIRRWVREFRKQHPELRPDLVVSHDYYTADVGYETARYFGAKFAIDCHEYARGQYMHDPKWTRRVRPYVVGVQDHYLARADAVTTVCDGIAELLNREQVLRRPVEVVRSVPFFVPMPFRPTGDSITVLYHGGIHHTRGLHKAVKSLALWRPEFQLLIRGNGDPEYIDRLWKIAAECGVANRLRIEPAVPFDRIVPEANKADIGYFVHKDVSPQKHFVLPNKYFEYVMAGLALCVSDLPEMARLVHQYGFGKLVPEYDEKAIAEVINSFDRSTIDVMKQRSVEAAKELNWEAEQVRMLGLYNEL